MARFKVIGPPGTGKTRRLLGEVQHYVKAGMPLDRIGYFAFTFKSRNSTNQKRFKTLSNNTLISI